MLRALLAALLAGTVILALPVPAHARPKADPGIEYAPSFATGASGQRPADGAIFHAADGYAALTSGARAAHVGDVLTIVLVERTQALKSNSADYGRSGSINIEPPATGPLSFIKKSSVTGGAGSNFNGKGGAQQSNELTGSISVTVAAVYPNGTMLVKGEKQLTLNRGDEQIRIAGLVRQADVDFDNSISSTRVADARITYSGTGEIARASRQGWLGRFFSRVSPF